MKYCIILLIPFTGGKYQNDGLTGSQLKETAAERINLWLKQQYDLAEKEAGLDQHFIYLKNYDVPEVVEEISSNSGRRGDAFIAVSGNDTLEKKDEELIQTGRISCWVTKLFHYQRESKEKRS